MAISIRIGTVPGRIEELALPDGSTVATALEHAADEFGMATEGRQVQVNGTPANDSTVLRDNSLVLLLAQIKGNQVTVRVGAVPGRIEEYALEHGATVQDAIDEAGLDAEGKQIQVNGHTATLGTALPEGALVLLTAQIKGN
jgi:hypothetical protein